MKKFNNTLLLVIPIFLVTILFVTSCTGMKKNNDTTTSEREGKMKYAENLFIDEKDDYTVVTVRNPWDTIKNLGTYILVDKNKDIPGNLPKGTVIKVPVENALVYSAIHCGLLANMGARNGIGGVCNAKFLTDSLLIENIRSKQVADCGEDMSPDIEKIIKLNPEIVMLSPFEKNDRYGKIFQLGIAVVECADYMENSALGQAEWMKFYGLLFGKQQEAFSRFSEIENRYNNLKKLTEKNTKRPRVMLDQIYGQSWSVPGGESTMSKLIHDAGGENPFAGYKKRGGVMLSPEKVLAEADNADIWLLRYNQKTDKTLSELSRDAAVNSQFKAFKLQNVYGCNTSYIPFFDETPFRPDLLLEELVRIINPGLLPDTTQLRYFKKLEK